MHTHLALKQAGTLQYITTRIETVDKLQAWIKKGQDSTLTQSTCPAGCKNIF